MASRTAVVPTQTHLIQAVWMSTPASPASDLENLHHQADKDSMHQ
jgi:hypothetical protein